MPFYVRQLLDGRREPITITADQSTKQAWDLMNQHGFSQLPVVGPDSKPIGIVTRDSILRALNNFDVKLSALQVRDAMEDAPKHGMDDDLFDLLDHLRDDYAVLIVDNAGNLHNIVTSYDAMEDFRCRNEARMHVQDIETTIRDNIRAAFTVEDGSVGEEQLEAAVSGIMPSNRDLQAKFIAALKEYLTKPEGPVCSVDAERAKAMFQKHLYRQEASKGFDQLSMRQYIDLFLHDNHWAYFEPYFTLEKPAIRKLLEAVRGTRNDLSHLRDNITPQQEDQLRFCKDWLARHAERIPVRDTHTSAALNDVVGTGTHVVVSGEVQPVPEPPEEIAHPEDSKYLLLGTELVRLGGTRAQISFSEIERIVGGELPTAAKQHRAWWSNDPQRSWARSWLDAGWRVARVNMSEQVVSFAKTAELEQMYIRFYSELLNELEHGDVALQSWSPDGSSWIQLAKVPADGTRVAFVVVSFARGQRFRLELYIDTGEADRNEHIFDAMLGRREDIERRIGSSLSWESLPKKRAARIALYREGSIHDGGEQLTALRRWIADTLPTFHATLASCVRELLDSNYQALILDAQ